MFFSKTKRKSAQAATKRNQTRTAQIETLEDRKLMTRTHIVLDFTPDTHRGSFYDTFRYTKNSQNQSPGFLDFNKDGYISKADASIAAGQVAARVQRLFANADSGYDVRVKYGDVLQNTNMGTKYVNWGLQRRNDQVQVIFIGGRNNGYLGKAPRANDGTNVEGYGCAYSQETALMLWKRQSYGYNVQSRDFVYSVASTVAHELGHMYGLRHARNQYRNDIMNPSQSLTPGNSAFINETRQTSDGTYQSAYNELRRSFAGQPTIRGLYGVGTYEMVAEEIEHGDDHDCCHENGKSTHREEISSTVFEALAAQQVDHLYGNVKTEFAKYSMVMTAFQSGGAGRANLVALGC